jgi:hypothetical protein
VVLRIRLRPMNMSFREENCHKLRTFAV